MEYLLPKQPFLNRYEFVGKLFSGKNQVVDKLHIVVTFSSINEGKIVGKVLGTVKTAVKLERLFGLPMPYLKLSSEKTESTTTCIFSEKMSLKNLSRRYMSSISSDEMTYVVSDLDFENITITGRYGHSESPERHLTFFLCGPQSLWQIRRSSEWFSTGEKKTEVCNSKIELNEELPFEIEVVPQYFYDETPTSDNFELIADVLTLHLKTEKPIEQLSDEDFVNSGKAIVNDLALLISFLSRSWVTWYRYQFQMNDAIETHVRRTRRWSTKEPDRHDALVEWNKTREFLKTGISNLRKLREEGLDLFMPILYFVSGNEAEYLEDKFTTLFLSLERIKDMFQDKKRKGLRRNQSDNAFKKLRSLISDVIKENIESSEVLERMQTKIPELNRPSLRFVLDSLFSEYNIDWRDIYPSASDFTLIKTRDKLFHSSQEVNIDILFKEVRRLQALIERLLLRMLGWEDLSCSPTDPMKEWLATVENDSNDT